VRSRKKSQILPETFQQFEAADIFFPTAAALTAESEEEERFMRFTHSCSRGGGSKAEEETQK
jgi:hypothetical protein